MTIDVANQVGRNYDDYPMRIKDCVFELDPNVAKPIVE